MVLSIYQQIILINLFEQFKIVFIRQAFVFVIAIINDDSYLINLHPQHHQNCLLLKLILPKQILLKQILPKQILPKQILPKEILS